MIDTATSMASSATLIAISWAAGCAANAGAQIAERYLVAVMERQVDRIRPRRREAGAEDTLQ